MNHLIDEEEFAHEYGRAKQYQNMIRMNETTMHNVE